VGGAGLQDNVSVTVACLWVKIAFLWRLSNYPNMHHAHNVNVNGMSVVVETLIIISSCGKKQKPAGFVI
jgi:hypothetical protein